MKKVIIIVILVLLLSPVLFYFGLSFSSPDDKEVDDNNLIPEINLVEDEDNAYFLLDEIAKKIDRGDYDTNGMIAFLSRAD